MDFYKSVAAVFVSVFSGFLLLGCAPEKVVSKAVDTASNSYSIVATVGMVADVARNVAGERARVVSLIGEGADPHLYNPTRGDVIKLSEADVIFYNGLLLEGKMTDVLVRIARSGKPVVAVTEAILESADYLLNLEAEPNYTDPHVWMDVSGWMQAVPVIVATLAAFDPDAAAVYEANGAAYLERLAALDAYVSASISTIPQNLRVLVTAHDAFQYFGRAYGMEVRGIQGMSTESEAGVRDLENLVEFIVSNQIPAVFVETSVSERNVHALVEGARSRGHRVVIGGTLFSDAMGAPGSYEGTYMGMIDHNVTTITNALGGRANGFRQQE